MIRKVNASRPPGILRRWFAALATTRATLFVSRHVNWKLDPILLRLTRGRVATTLMIPAAVLETRGARTGASRRHAVIYWQDGTDIIIAASQAGSSANPAWYHNLLAHPDVTFGGTRMVAEVVDGEDTERLWRLGDNVFPAFATYRRMAAAAGRTIPLIALRPSPHSKLPRKRAH